jgi:hypothetical protein
MWGGEGAGCFIGENKQKGYEGGKFILPSQHSKKLILL